jgi:hypothetical protein
MAKEIIDYLHLYLGCQCTSDMHKTGRFSGLEYCQNDNSIVMITVKYSDDADDWAIFNDSKKLNRITLILNPIEAIEHLPEELRTRLKYALGKICADSFIQWLIYNRNIAEGEWQLYEINSAVSLLRKWGFDCDGLIDEGLAINAAEFKNGSIDEIINWRMFLFKYKMIFNKSINN